MRSGSNSARHWLLGNVPGHVLKAGFSNENTTAGVDIMQPFHGPHPPAPGTPGRTDYIHVYGQFAWKQPTPTIKFAPMDPDRHSCALPHTPSYPLPRRSGRICTAHLSTRALTMHWPLASERDTIFLDLCYGTVSLRCRELRSFHCTVQTRREASCLQLPALLKLASDLLV